MGSMRLVIVHQGDSCFGYVFERSLGSCTAHFEGSFDANKKELKGISPGFIEKDFGHGLARYTLKYDSSGFKETLTGRAKPKSIAAQILSFGKSFHCALYRTNGIPDTTSFMTAGINRQKTAAIVSQPERGLLPETGNPPIEPRSNEILHTITAKKGVLICKLYDNGVYDHDTVTILLNNKIIINKTEVSAKAVSFEINLSAAEPVHEIIFYANNLGEIPPNTGMLLIEAGDKRFSLRLKADLSNNGKIIIRLSD